MALKSRLLWSERTIYHNSPPEIKISMDPFIQSFGTKIVSFGSCFALHMSTILEEQGFDAYFDVNNCQHFSPAGLMEKIEDIYLQKELEDADIYHHEKKGIKFSKRHTKLAISEVDAEAQLKSVSKQLNERAFHEIKDADLIVLTLGTATYIRDKTCGRIVTSANGMRQEDFTLHRATVSEVLLQLERIFTYLEKIASKHPKFVITLSPQRYGWLSISDRFSASEHGKTLSLSNYETDGIVYSNTDKAIIRAAIHEFLDNQSERDIIYFPSYEIVMDELRSIETFQNNLNDLLHVNAHQTPNYVVHRFLEKSLSDEMKECMEYLSDLGSQIHFSSISPSSEITAKLDETLEKLLAFIKNLDAYSIVEKVINVIANDYSSSFTLEQENLFNEIMQYYLDKAKSGEFRIKRFFQKIDQLAENGNRVAIFGTGNFCNRLMLDTKVNNCTITFFEDEGFPKKELFFGQRVTPISEANMSQFDFLIIASVDFADKWERVLVHKFGRDLPIIRI